MGEKITVDDMATRIMGEIQVRMDEFESVRNNPWFAEKVWDEVGKRIERGEYVVG